MLTIAQRERLNVVIDNDCEIRYKYSDAKGATCALGGMAKAIGIWYPSEGMASNNTEVPVPGVWVIKPTKNRYISHMANELCNFYGLTRGQLRRIQVLNDASHNQELRKERIHRFLDTITEGRDETT